MTPSAPSVIFQLFLLVMQQVNALLLIIDVPMMIAEPRVSSGQVHINLLELGLSLNTHLTKVCLDTISL